MWKFRYLKVTKETQKQVRKSKTKQKKSKKKTLSNTFALFKVLLVLTNARLDYQIEWSVIEISIQW